jgi:hypothetical protein
VIEPVKRSEKLVAEAGKSKEKDCPPLKAATKQRLVKTKKIFCVLYFSDP